MLTEKHNFTFLLAKGRNGGLYMKIFSVKFLCDSDLGGMCGFEIAGDISFLGAVLCRTFR